MDFCKLFFGDSPDPGASEKHSGIKSLRGGQRGPGSPQTISDLLTAKKEIVKR